MYNTGNQRPDEHTVVDEIKSHQDRGPLSLSDVKGVGLLLLLRRRWFETFSPEKRRPNGTAGYRESAANRHHI